MTASRETMMNQWAAPQQRFDSIRARAERGAGRSLCDLAYANQHGGPPPQVRNALHEAVDRDRALNLQYTPYGGATIPRRLVAQSLQKTHAQAFRWSDIILTPGAMAGLNILFRSVMTDGPEPDEVIVPVPCWLDYPLYLANLGLRPRLVPLGADRFDLDLDAIAEAVGPNTRAIVLSQPCNPTGRTFSRAELTSLTKILDTAPSHPLLISDECHRDVQLGEAAFVSPAEIYDRTCVVYSFGKSLSIQGQRIGYVAVSPKMRDRSQPEFASRLEQFTRAMGFATPTALMQSALSRLLKIEPDWSNLKEKKRRVLAAFAEKDLPVPPSDATFFLYPPIGQNNDFAVTETLAAQGVLVLPSAMFHHHGHLRLSLTCSDEALNRAIPIITETLATGQPL
jgi:aspartate aminotransferase